jgi:hypothetical protein
MTLFENDSVVEWCSTLWDRAWLELRRLDSCVEVHVGPRAETAHEPGCRRRRLGARQPVLRRAHAGVEQTLRGANYQMVVKIPAHATDARARIGALLDEVRPTAIFAANNLLADQNWLVLRDRQLSIPADISLVAFDDVSWREWCSLGSRRSPRRPSRWADGRRSSSAGSTIPPAAGRRRC